MRPGKYTYVANGDEKTYFRVPSSWHLVDQTPIDDYFIEESADSALGQARRQAQWSAAYDADTDDPRGQHMVMLAATDDPIVYVSVRHLPTVEQDLLSFDYMRDIFFPVSQRYRAYLAQSGQQQLTSFESLSDEVLPVGDNGVHGVRVIFNYRFPNGVIHTFEQTAFANADSSILYLMLIRCTARCYRERAAEIHDIATSFTVRSKA